MIIVMYKMFNPAVFARPTAHSQIGEVFDSNFECVKPFFREILIGISDSTA